MASSLSKFLSNVSEREPWLVTWYVAPIINLPERSFSWPYKSKEEAIARANDEFVTGVHRVKVEEARNIETWKQNGYYHLVGKRRQGEKFKENE